MDQTLLKTKVIPNEFQHPDTGNSIHLGKRADEWAYFFDGALDSVAVWKGKTLSPSEIEKLWNNGNGLSYKDLKEANNVRISISEGNITTTGCSSPTIYVNGKKGSSVNQNKWQHVTVTTNGSGVNASSMILGTASGSYLQGGLDEVRLSGAKRSTAWIQTAYANQKNPGRFLRPGTEEKK